MRTYIKRFVMNAYCDGWTPAAMVTLMFRLFRLKAQ